MKLLSRYAVVLIALACLTPTGDIQANSVPRHSAPPDKFEVARQKQIPQIPFQASLSPDGRSVLVVTGGRLTTRFLESPVETQLLPVGSITTLGTGWAAWSADGKWIYYLQSSDQPWVWDLWQLEIASGKQKRLIKNAGTISVPRPQVSPDGKSIAFYRGHTLLLAGADGQNERMLSELVDQQGSMAWSPDSSQILVSTFSGYNAGDRSQLKLLTVSTGQVKTLAPWQGSISSIVWPAWGSGAFLCTLLPGPSRVFRETIVQIWHLSLPGEERTLVTGDTPDYLKVFGAGPDRNSLVVQQIQPPPDPWTMFTNMLASRLRLGVPQYAQGHLTFLLTLKK
jgi:dipeptidyl aminopeptidase/acylaminoacyl peptidase